MVSHTTTFLLEERRVAFKVESLPLIQSDKFGWTVNDAVFLCMSALPLQDLRFRLGVTDFLK